MKSITSIILLSLLLFTACKPSHQEIDASLSSVITLKKPGNPVVSNGLIYLERK